MKLLAWKRTIGLSVAALGLSGLGAGATPSKPGANSDLALAAQEASGISPTPPDVGPEKVISASSGQVGAPTHRCYARFGEPAGEQTPACTETPEVAISESSDIALTFHCGDVQLRAFLTPFSSSGDKKGIKMDLAVVRALQGRATTVATVSGFYGGAQEELHLTLTSAAIGYAEVACVKK